MKNLLPIWAQPLNFFHLHGTVCCHNMYQEYNARHFDDYRFCYEAKLIYEANSIILWGSISKKLINIIINQTDNLNGKNIILHMRGCDQRIDNEYSSSSLAHLLPINIVFSHCKPSPQDYEHLIAEARQCLRA